MKNVNCVGKQKNNIFLRCYGYKVTERCDFLSLFQLLLFPRFLFSLGSSLSIFETSDVTIRLTLSPVLYMTKTATQ